MENKRELKYYPWDFGILPALPIHMGLTFDMHEDHAFVTNIFTMQNKGSLLSRLELDAKNLEIKGIYLYEDEEGKGEYNKIIYEYNKDDNKLVLYFQNQIKENAKFTIRTETVCIPTDNILEGMYYDETPNGAPKTIITQCQQWGFSRIAPCFDDMTAKCRYTTTIIADSRYTNLISNGDPVSKKEDLGNGRSKIIYQNIKTPMAPYVFFLGVGTYSTFSREFEYPDGSIFDIELLVHPNSDYIVANRALDMIAHGVMWIYLNTGKECYEDKETKEKIWKLIEERNELKKNRLDEKLSKVRQQLQELTQNIVPGYKYTGKIYREIAMQNSNFGGMENVGNTTIVANNIMPYPELSDNSFEYMLAVKLHEFYHNINGSEVTGVSPFELWLNEAVTVLIEQQYEEEMFGEDYSRLGTIKGLYAPMYGTFAEDLSPTSMPVIPDGFNMPDELITGVTYVKAPEFVRMIRALISKENFVKALEEYHTKFKHSNATTNDWLSSMQQYTRVNLIEFADLWLRRTGYPTVYAKTLNDGKSYAIELEQAGYKDGKPWQIPIKIALVDFDGNDIAGTQKTFLMKEQKMSIKYNLLEHAPAFASISRGHSFYGKLINLSATHNELVLQAQYDKDIICRYMAFAQILENEKVKLINDINQKVSEEFLDIFGKILKDDALDIELKPSFLAISDSVMDDSLAHKYQEIYDAKEKIKRAVAARYKDTLFNYYNSLNNSMTGENYVQTEVANIKQRRMKNLCLSLLSVFDDDEIYPILKKQMQNKSATDKYVAFSLYLNTSAQDRIDVVQKMRDIFASNMVSWESYIKCISSTDNKDVIALIKMVERNPKLNINSASDQRSLYMPFAMNRKVSIITKQGCDFLIESIIKLSKLNEYTVFNLLPAFSHLDKLKTNDQVMLVEGLLKVMENISEKDHPSVYNNIKRILESSKTAVLAFEKAKGGVLRL